MAAFTRIKTGNFVNCSLFALYELTHPVSPFGQWEYFLLLNSLLVVAVLILLVEMGVDIAAAWLKPRFLWEEDNKLFCYEKNRS